MAAIIECFSQISIQIFKYPDMLKILIETIHSNQNDLIIIGHINTIIKNAAGYKDESIDFDDY